MVSDGANEKSMELSNRSEGDNTRRVFTPSHGADTHSHVAGQSLHCLYLVINELSKPMMISKDDQLVLLSVGTLGLYMHAC